MQLYRLCLTLFAALLGLGLLAACNSGPKTLDDCLLKASRESQNDRQFRNMADSCKQRFPKR
jgi:hypothetical protein